MQNIKNLFKLIGYKPNKYGNKTKSIEGRTSITPILYFAKEKFDIQSNTYESRGFYHYTLTLENESWNGTGSTEQERDSKLLGKLLFICNEQWENKHTLQH